MENMVNLFLIRHGQSEQNAGLVDGTGKPDHLVKLTEHGKFQAIVAGKILRDYIDTNFEITAENQIMYVSPFERTRETSIEANGYLGIENIKEHQMLVEVDFGIFNNMSRKDIEKLFYVEQRHIRNIFNNQGRMYSRFPLGESCLDCEVRQRLFLEDLRRDLERHPEIKVIVIVGHGAALNCLVKVLLKQSPEWYNNERIPDNCSIRHLIFDGYEAEDCGFIS